MNSLKRLAQADIVFYLLPLIMLNLAAGTLAERSIGLYAAQETFFASFILWFGPLPLPGGYTLAALLAFSLLLKFLLDSDWNLRKSGINLSHLGVLVLLVGGLLTSLTAKEGYMLLGEGDESPYVYDYHQRDLYIFENDNLLDSIPFGKTSASATLPFSLSIPGQCANCAIVRRDTATADLHGMARFMQLENKTPEKDPEQNISGLTLNITGLSPQRDGTYIVFEGMPKPIEFAKSGRNYKIIFGKQQRLLPFSVKLKKFTRENYPGTIMAKSYSSDVEITDHGAAWPDRIEMNKPLRYKGYTFYQSSFGETPDKEMSVLSVVENKGRIFPYIGTALIALGLLLHLWIMARDRKQA